jgi:hypothetical protein
LASVENCHVFAEPTLGQKVAPRNRKTFPPCAEAVEDETSLWKPEEIYAGIMGRKMGSSLINNLDAVKKYPPKQLPNELPM